MAVPRHGPHYYTDSADVSPFPFVQDTWHSLVVPHLAWFITLLIVCEALVGALVLSGGRRAQVCLLALIGFHIGQLAVGGMLWPWAILMLVTLVLLLRDCRDPVPLRTDGAQHEEASDWGQIQTWAPRNWNESVGNLVLTRKVPTATAAAATATVAPAGVVDADTGNRHRHRHLPTVTTSRIATNHIGPVPRVIQLVPANSRR